MNAQRQPREGIRATLDKRRDDVASMFDNIAPRYDLLNDVLSLGQDRGWRRETIKAVEPQPRQLILDLAAGTGTSSQALAESGATVVPADLSFGMLHQGRKQYPALSFINADALQLPFPDETFDAVTISYGLRNVEHTLEALQEMLRVTRRGGRIVVNEFSTPTNPAFRRVYKDYLLRALPPLAKISPNPVAYSYLADSIMDWPDQRTLAELMTQAGWTSVEWRNLTGGIVALHRGRRP